MKGGARPGMTAKQGSRSRRSRPRAPTADSYDTRKGPMKTAQLFHGIDEAASSETRRAMRCRAARSLPGESVHRFADAAGRRRDCAREAHLGSRDHRVVRRRRVNSRLAGSVRDRNAAVRAERRLIRHRAVARAAGHRAIIEGHSVRLRLPCRDGRCIWYRVRIHAVSNASLPPFVRLMRPGPGEGRTGVFHGIRG